LLAIESAAYKYIIRIIDNIFVQKYYTSELYNIRCSALLAQGYSNILALNQCLTIIALKINKKLTPFKFDCLYSWSRNDLFCKKTFPEMVYLDEKT
jgi:hypothetical protein